MPLTSRVASGVVSLMPTAPNSVIAILVVRDCRVALEAPALDVWKRISPPAALPVALPPAILISAPAMSVPEPPVAFIVNEVGVI